ncbi:protein transporter Sec31 [Streptomyces racemochromogenes]|uniref:protein transporter Sec31 n=1 Tax=Streptomyces racemochromogenes TaxID=67353 RepID=UPI0031E895AE
MRTRTETRTRQVPHTVDGKTHLVDEAYEIHLPVPPRDWDHTVRTGVLGAACLILTGSVVWSTASIGALLDLLVIAPAAYAAAVTFDLVWISCMALEWLARYDPPRAQAPRAAGHIALGVAMAAVAMHGYAEEQLPIGITGAVVSGMAKGLWTVLLAQTTPRLSPQAMQWAQAERAELGSRLGMIPLRRELARAEGLVEAEEASLRTTPDTDPGPPEDGAEVPEGASQLPASGPMTMADAVRTAVSCGITEPNAVIRYVRKVADANAKEDSILRTLRMARRPA